MDNSVGSTIEKIKLLEQDKEAKLKEKRELETAFATLNRGIREKTMQTEKSQQEQQSLIKNISILSTQIAVEKIRYDALAKQLDTFNKELEELRNKSGEGISSVWQRRSNFCKAIHDSCDKYDIWALLMKPAQSLLVNERIYKKEEKTPVLENEDRLNAAAERRNKAIKDRDILKAEPDNGEEFVRIKNALRYSLEKIEELRNK